MIVSKLKVIRHFTRMDGHRLVTLLAAISVYVTWRRQWYYASNFGATSHIFSLDVKVTHVHVYKYMILVHLKEAMV